VTAGLARFPRERTWLLPALHAVQRALGWLPESALREVAAHLRVPASEVWGVASHYPEFRLAPRGRHHVRVCTGVSCRLLGSDRWLEEAARRLGVAPGEVGAGREVTLEAADCLFACSVAPVVEVDGALRGRVVREDVARLPAWLAESAGVAADTAEPAEAGPEAVGPAADQGSTGPGAVGGHEADGAPTPAAPAGDARAALAALVARAESAPRPALRLLVGTGTCGRAVGADALLHGLRRAVVERGSAAAVVEGACHGMCYAAPSVEVQMPGAPRFVLERVEPARAAALLDALQGADDLAAAGFAGVVFADTGWRGLTPVTRHPFLGAQRRVLLARAGALDPGSLDDALRAGAYAALARALDGSPEAVIAEVRAAGLQGRGGAFFPTAAKWEACRRAAGRPKYVVMNGEEGEPGIFKDRHLMEGDPHLVLEGVLLAAYAAGAERAILYVHGEADLAAARLARAVEAARAAGVVGPRVLGRDFGCEVEIRRGAGGFVLGEETALLESIEGRRAQPRPRPPFPVEAGLWGRPTVVNNVETLAAVPIILREGGAAFAARGTPEAPGTKLFGLSGPLRRPGVVEVSGGTPLRTLLEAIAGGPPDGRPLKGALVGGPSGSVVPAGLFDVPLAPRGRVSPGTGGVVAVPEGAAVADLVRTLVGFNARESCGKCTPCREGLPRLLALLDGPDRDETRLRELAETIQHASLCGLGQAAPLSLLRALEDFGGEFEGSR
jgi:NADH:ubiquinone oxidoreductase subunit F (NADH-binding)/NADH:ubiquinone oxidoreductase subunit E